MIEVNYFKMAIIYSKLVDGKLAFGLWVLTVKVVLFLFFFFLRFEILV